MNSPFDPIRQTDINGKEYWSARDLQGLMGYKNWREFNDSIERAQIACSNSGKVALDHFGHAPKMIKAGKGAQREVDDYHLTRYACYLIAMNGDPRKEEVSQAQTYFAAQTYYAETIQAKNVLPDTTKGFTNKLLIDRIRLFNEKNNITSRKFCIFQEVAWDFFSAEMRGSTLPEGAVPDGSVGRRWSDNIKAKGYDMSLVVQYPHHYPDQRKTRFASLYPIEWLPDFKIWFREVYLPIYFPLYLRDSLNIKGPEVKLILTAFRVVEQIGN